jgi:hypothetical protein
VVSADGLANNEALLAKWRAFGDVSDDTGPAAASAAEWAMGGACEG